jgi:hypothetical protein
MKFKVEFLPSLIIVNKEKIVLSESGRKNILEISVYKAFEK